MNHTRQRGGSLIGFIFGLIVGLGAALAVAVYVTKVPVPFLSKGNGWGAEMDAAESKKNKNWDPNTPLYGKNPARAADPAAAASAPTSAAAPEPPAAAATPKAAEAKPKAESPIDTDPWGDQAKAAAARGSPDPFDYFVQVGAFRSQAEADAQRARLAMLGWEARMSEREQNGRPVFRVRVGPFGKRDDAEQIKQKLDGAGVESALVRVQR